MNDSSAILEGWLYVPHREIGDGGEVLALKERLTYMPKFDDTDRGPVRLYDEKREGYLGIPRAFGLHRYAHLPVIDHLSDGQEMIDRALYRRPDPNHVNVLDPASQAQFMADLHETSLGHETYIAMAPTGSGKTVCFLDLALQLQRKTIVFVHLERLMHQWIEKALMGLIGVPRHRIGIVQGPRCEYEDRDFVIAMLPTMNLYSYPPEFYRAFGLCGFDEVHKIGSRFFAPTVPMFPVRFKVGLSATPRRRDGGDRVFVWHLGPRRVTSKTNTTECHVYPLPYSNDEYQHPDKYDWRAPHGALGRALGKDKRRNQWLLRTIKRFYDNGRQALIVGSDVKHLQTLMRMAQDIGIPNTIEAMGQFTGEVHVPASKGVKARKVKQKKETLDAIQTKSQLIFATYGMMTEGIDIPRLDAGMDVDPRGMATQLIGRIRRPLPDKKTAVWITPVDEDCPKAKRLFGQRLRDYLGSQAEVIGYGKTT